MSKNKLLIDEYPLVVLPTLAKMIGLNEAIAVQQVHFWTNTPKGYVEIDGVRWVYNTYPKWQADNFPFWSVKTVERVFQSCEKLEVLLSMQRAAYDRKKYYRVHYPKLGSWNAPNWGDGIPQDGGMQDDKKGSSLSKEKTEENTKKNELIKILRAPAMSILDFRIWNKWRKQLESDSVVLSGDENKIVIHVSGMWDKQFSLAEYWEDLYTRPFKNLGMELEFVEVKND